MATITKIDELQDQLPSSFNAATNPNWKAVVGAIGQEDENIAQLVAAVRQQFFVKTASRPYLDNLAANSNISRPKFLGMTDPTFQQYIPILSYQPKQVKHIIDQLLNIFFTQESTTAYVTSTQAQPFVLVNGSKLQYLVDNINQESLTFLTTDFANISAATAEEIASSINRQALYSYAVSQYDNASQNTFVRIFTKTTGSKGSITLQGGSANTVLQFTGFNINAGNGADTQWTVTKVGQTVTFTWTGGTNPNINQLLIGDIVTIGLSGNIGSFPITAINLANNSITFVNLFATPGSYTQTSDLQVKFFTPNKYVAFTNNNRAMTWEVEEDEIVVEMPASPPVVKRSLIGSSHLNGPSSVMQSYVSSTSLILANTTHFPSSGSFFLQPVYAILDGSDNVVTTINGRLIGTPIKYTYTSISGNQLNGISPALPALAATDVIGLATSGSLIILTDSVPASVSGIIGPYVWSKTAPFVLSENTAQTAQLIQAGQIIKLLNVSPNTIPAGGGFVVFDYGLDNQEGPVKYLYAPNDATLALDPSYTFQFEHSIGADVVSIDNMGPHVMSGLGTEYPPYITDLAQARIILENLILSVKSAGIFIDFLIRYPEQFYGLYNVYDQ
jgi:hypothetical protein